MAVVLPGGGARAAYQVGVIETIGKHFPRLRFPTLIGISAGAINTAFLAQHPEPLGVAAPELRKIWESIGFADVFRVDVSWLARNLARWGARLALGGGPVRPQVRGLVETTPLRKVLERMYRATDGEIAGIDRNLRSGALESVAVLTLDYATGQTVIWVQGRQIETWERPTRIARRVRLTLDHVLASAALPFLFPAIRLGASWHGDGGMRLTAPLSPALHLGADRILAVSTCYDRSRAEADQPSTRGYPPPAQIAGNLMNAIFLDLLDEDLQRMQRVNDLVKKLPPGDRGEMRPIDVCSLRPSQDLGRLTARYESELPRGFRFLTRSLGTRETDSPDFLSLLMFHPDYIRELLDLGRQDAEAKLDEIAAWVGDGWPAPG